MEKDKQGVWRVLPSPCVILSKRIRIAHLIFTILCFQTLGALFYCQSARPFAVQLVFGCFLLSSVTSPEALLVKNLLPVHHLNVKISVAVVSLS